MTKQLTASFDLELDLPLLPGPKPVRPLPIPLPQVRANSVALFGSSFFLRDDWN
jgi:hypothetical protein